MAFGTIAGVTAILMAAAMVSAADYPKAETVWCAVASRCSDAYVKCPAECASTTTPNANGKPNCDAPGSACYDPRFVGGDGRVFYFHGKSGEVFSLVSDPSFQINGRFIGHRPVGRPRDFTWIQSLGLLSKTHRFTLEATRAAVWDGEADHLKFTYNGQDLSISEGSLSAWQSPDGDVRVERVSTRNSVIVTIRDKAEILVSVVPVTKEDDRIHKYRVPENDCFAHLEVQFRFFELSPRVEGVLGRTYQPDFENNVARPGVAMPVMGGEDKYRTSGLVSAECGACIFSEAEDLKQGNGAVDFPTLDCTRGAAAGYGIVCRK
ncbi:unnamed protein product [Linum tenue]|uniref:Uncharacterized protein n=1 Tax=Linum tenue TaxID=586396 RepID=A0AAV0LX34_9ROSI|nr:unnamed protein product [Linum tenue]